MRYPMISSVAFVARHNMKRCSDSSTLGKDKSVSLR